MVEKKKQERIRIRHVALKYQENQIFLNIFANNSMAEAIETWYFEGYNNSWDNGKLGNYWGDYQSRYSAAINDGVTWNVAYLINGIMSVYDFKPLVKPQEVPVEINVPNYSLIMAFAFSMTLAVSCAIIILSFFVVEIDINRSIKKSCERLNNMLRKLESSIILENVRDIIEIKKFIDDLVSNDAKRIGKQYKRNVHIQSSISRFNNVIDSFVLKKRMKVLLKLCEFQEKRGDKELDASLHFIFDIKQELREIKDLGGNIEDILKRLSC